MQVIRSRRLSSSKGNGYVGLDANGVLGWATFADMTAATYSAVLSMPHDDDIGRELTAIRCSVLRIEASLRLAV